MPSLNYLVHGSNLADAQTCRRPGNTGATLQAAKQGRLHAHARTVGKQPRRQTDRQACRRTRASMNCGPTCTDAGVHEEQTLSISFHCAMQARTRSGAQARRRANTQVAVQARVQARRHVRSHEHRRTRMHAGMQSPSSGQGGVALLGGSAHG